MDLGGKVRAPSTLPPSLENARKMKEKSHRAAQGCYRSGSETFLRHNARRLDGYSLYTDKPEFEQLAHPSIY